ncbi:hypothetical protein KEM54_006350 [Ascosphaera aggregata]|nr:hypothetical protein KEM54_006350 [Ascosphaera aggregata]
MSTRVTRSSTRSTPTLDSERPVTDQDRLNVTKRSATQSLSKGVTPKNRVSKRAKRSAKAVEEVEQTAGEPVISRDTSLQVKESDEEQHLKIEDTATGTEIISSEKTSEGQTLQRKRKTTETEKAIAEMPPLASRTKGLRMFVGAHISAAGGRLRQLNVKIWPQLTTPFQGFITRFPMPSI